MCRQLKAQEGQTDSPFASPPFPIQGSGRTPSMETLRETPWSFRVPRPGGPQSIAVPSLSPRPQSRPSQVHGGKFCRSRVDRPYSHTVHSTAVSVGVLICFVFQEGRTFLEAVLLSWGNLRSSEDRGQRPDTEPLVQGHRGPRGKEHRACAVS